MDTRGDIAQQIIWDEYLDAYGFTRLVDLIVLEGKSLKTARRISANMRGYWERRPVRQPRPGRNYFPAMLAELLENPEEPPGMGGQRPREDNVFVGGRVELDFILSREPGFQPLAYVDPSDFYGAIDYVSDITTGVSSFIYFEGTTVQAYLGETDTPLPEHGEG